MYTDNNNDNYENDNFNNINNAPESNGNFDNNLDVDNDFYKYDNQQNDNFLDNKPKKTKKIVLYIIIALVILLALFGSLAFFYFRGNNNSGSGGNGTEQPVLTPNLVLNITEFNLKVGNTKKIEYTIENDNGNVVINWKTSDAKIATVDENGTVKAIKAGKATITASYTIDGQTYEKNCTVTVEKNSSSTGGSNGGSTGGGSGSSGTTTPTVDKTDPKLSYTITKGKKNDWVNTDVEIKVTASDNVGVNTIQYTKNCTSNCKYTTIKNNGVITISDAGSTTVTIIASDKAGNDTKESVTVKIDKIKPTCSLDVNETGTLTAKSVGDTGGSDLAYNGFSSTYSGTPVTSKTLSAAGTYTYYVKDKAGNTSTCSLEVKTKTQYRYQDCNKCKSCNAAGCVAYGNVMSTNTVCRSSNSGLGQVGKDYLVITCPSEKNDSTAEKCPGQYTCTEKRYYCTKYNTSCASCGCETYGSWSAWSDKTATKTAERNVETKTVYYK